MHILLNGEPLQTGCRSLWALRHASPPGGPDVVAIRNGFATASDAPLCEGDEIFLIEKGKLPPPEKLEAMLSARHTPGVYQKLKAGRVAVAGLGGLGSSLAVMLARSGVGELLLVDFDVVEPSNLNRQSYLISHLGMKKTDAMKKQLEEINPFLKLCTKDLKITQADVKPLFEGYDILCEAFDDPEQKAMLITTCLSQVPGIKVVASSGMAGYFSSNTIKTKRQFERLYLCGDGESEAQPGCGLMAPRVSICAGHQANCVLRLLLGLDGD